MPNTSGAVLSCTACAEKYETCKRFGRNARGEINSQDHNSPVAIFNGVGHSILVDLDEDERPWIEAVCRTIEGDPRASDFEFVDQEGLAERIREEHQAAPKIGSDPAKLCLVKYSPQAPAPTEYLYDPKTLPVYSARYFPPSKPIKGAKRLSIVDVPSTQEPSYSPPSHPYTRSRKRKHDSQMALEVPDTGVDDLFGPMGPLLLERNEGGCFSDSSSSRFTERRPSHRGSGQPRIRPKRPHAESLLPVELGPGPSTFNNPALAHRKMRLAAPVAISRDDTDHLEVNDLKPVADQQECQSKYVYPQGAEGPSEPSRVPASSEPLFTGETSEEDDATPRPTARLSSSQVGRDEAAVRVLDRVASSGRVTLDSSQIVDGDRSGSNLEEILEQWRKDGGAPSALRQHPGIAIHISNLRSAHSSAVARENQAILDQRRYEAAETRLTGMPFGLFKSEWVGTHDPELWRELFARLCVEYSGDSIENVDISRYHTGDLRGVLGMRGAR